MPDRCARCGTEDDIPPLGDGPGYGILAEAYEETWPAGPTLDDLCRELWLLELIVFMCKQPNGSGLCQTCLSHRR